MLRVVHFQLGPRNSFQLGPSQQGVVAGAIVVDAIDLIIANNTLVASEHTVMTETNLCTTQRGTVWFDTNGVPCCDESSGIWVCNNCEQLLNLIYDYHGANKINNIKSNEIT
uniref:Uncharacterized protein n=1 Tax=Panagrellus redivivus TaxID=6233 RepID=A0A7E4UT95_PANRE